MSALTTLNQEIAACPDCDLCRTRSHAVPGEGPEDAEIMFVGEAPGFYEDQQARPFVGPAGRFLEELLASVGLRRDQVFIANVIKCRPPENRDPMPGEIMACGRWLERQLDLIKPRVIVTLGRFSMAKYFPGETISKVHGRSKRIGGIIYFAMYHPAAALHQGNLRRVIEADILKLPAVLAEADKMEDEKERPAQLNLF